MGRAKPSDVGRARPHRCNNIHRYACVVQNTCDFFDVVAMTEPKTGWPKKVRRDLGRLVLRLGQMAHQLEERLISAKVFFALIARKLKRDHRDRQAKRFGQPARIVLDKFSCTGRTDDHRLWLEPLVRFARRVLEQRGGIGPQVTCLECRVSDRWAVPTPLDHREQKIGISITLRRMQDIV